MNKQIVTALSIATLSFPALAEEDLRALVKALSAQLSEVNNQVKQSNQRIADLEKKLQDAEQRNQKAVSSPTQTPVAASGGKAAVAAPDKSAKPAITVGDVKGTFKIPGTDTSVGFGGMAKLDTNYSSISAGKDKLGDQVLVVSQIPVGNDRQGENSQTTFHAKDSRLWFKSFTPSSWGDINTFLEVDLFGSSETYTYNFRLRHAYGSIGNFLGGFTWSTFLNTAALPDTIDNTATAGNLQSLRQPLVRWTQPFEVGGKSLEFQAALESPQSRFWMDPDVEKPNTYGFVTPSDDRYPDVVARLNYLPHWGSLSLSGLGRSIRYSPAKASSQQEAWGGAVSLAGRIDFLELDNVRFMLGYGNALGRYTTSNTYEDAILDETGHIQLVNSYSAMLAYQHWWDKSWRSTVAYGYSQADQPSEVTGDITRQSQSAIVNLLWSPVKQTTFGLEYIYATRTTVSDETGDLHRLIFSTRFMF